MRSPSRVDVKEVTLTRDFYEGDTVKVARQLLGNVLVRELNASRVQGIIVETEAYRGCDDPASHAYGGPTRRNEVMFGEAGHAYVYFTYGMHYCLNVTTEPIDQPGAVLIRAVQPVEGIEKMRQRRGIREIRDLANGPAKLTQAFAVTKCLNGHDLTLGKKLFILEAEDSESFEVVSTTRIGIKTGLEKPWRFFIKGNPFVSKQ